MDKKRGKTVGRITGSHQKSILFDATSSEGKQLFKQYYRFNASTFLDYLKQKHRKFPKCYLYLDKAKQHYKSKKILHYFDKHIKDLVSVYLLTASPEFMVLEEIWHIAKKDLLVVQYDLSFTNFKNKISQYIRTKRFNLDMRNIC